MKKPVAVLTAIAPNEAAARLTQAESCAPVILPTLNPAVGRCSVGKCWASEFSIVCSQFCVSVA